MRPEYARRAKALAQTAASQTPDEVRAELCGLRACLRAEMNCSTIEERLKSAELLATGQTSEVFSWGEQRVLKLFLPWVSRETAEQEFRATVLVHTAGVAVPAAFELVQVKNRHGIVLERVVGRSLLRQVELQPWLLFRAARQLAELHSQLHDRAAPEGLQRQHDQIARWINGDAQLTTEQKLQTRQHLAHLPAGTSLCHGDFHPGNIILTAKGPLIIDWAAGSCGHPLGDVARTSVLFESASLPPSTPLHIKLLMKLSRQLLHVTYLKRYLQLRPSSLQEIETWRVAQRMAGIGWRAQQKAAMARVAGP
jgi:uncharacterized protein (TIGR02172 family)